MQIDSISPELRNSLWSLLKLSVWDNVGHPAGTDPYLRYNPEIDNFCRVLWFDYFKKPLDTLGDNFMGILVSLRKYFFEAEWYEVYDFIEFVIAHFPYQGRSQFIKVCNEVLQREVSAY